MELPQIPRPLLGVATRLPAASHAGAGGSSLPTRWLHRLLNRQESGDTCTVTLDAGIGDSGLRICVSDGNGSVTTDTLHPGRALALANGLLALRIEQLANTYRDLDLHAAIRQHVDQTTCMLQTGFMLASPDGEEFVLMSAGLFGPELSACGRLGLIGDRVLPYEALAWTDTAEVSAVASIRAAYQRLPPAIADLVVDALGHIGASMPTCYLSDPEGGTRSVHVYALVSQAPDAREWDTWLHAIRRINTDTLHEDGSQFVGMDRDALDAALREEARVAELRHSYIANTPPAKLSDETAEERAILQTDASLDASARRAYRQDLLRDNHFPTRVRGDYPFHSGQASAIKNILQSL